MKLYAVFGDPIAHSKSPLLHNYVFHKLGIDAKYMRYLLESTAKASDFRELFFGLRLSGANITLPHKENLFHACDEIENTAERIGAINTIVCKDSRLIGYNTDALGFYRNISADIKSALILGAGGSAKAIACILKEHDIIVNVANRSDKNFPAFARENIECYLYDELEKRLSRNLAHFDIIINATSSSIDSLLPTKEQILIGLFSHAKVAFDLMYGKKLPFLELAKTCGITTMDGAKMLLYQAIEASSLFLDMSSDIIEPIMREVY